MYWVPLLPLNNKNWTGLALPIPLPITSYFNNYCVIKNSLYKISTDKIFTTPTTGCKHVTNTFDYKFTKNFSAIKGLKISLSGRLKGISKAKKLVITNGIIRPQSIDNKLTYYSRPVYTKWGTLGLKVIC